MVLNQVLVELYNRAGQRSLRVIAGQGYDPLNIRFDKDQRENYALGSVFKMDLRLHSTGKYYISSYINQTLQDTYFAGSVNDPKVLEVLSKHSASPKVAAPTRKPSDGVPPIPSSIKLSTTTWQFLNHAIDMKQYPMLLGPKGCGKSSLAKAIAEAKGLDFYEFDLGQVMKPTRFFLGGMVIDETGKTVKVRSEFFKAFTSEKPTLIFLDEITRTQAAAANFLMTVLASNQSFIYDQDLGQRFNKGKDVTFIAAGNNGYQYTSTGRIDSAFEDRFVKIPVDYLSASQEAQLVQSRYPEVPSLEAERLCSVASALREAERKHTLSVSLSTRQVLMAASYIPLGYSVTDVVKLVLLQNYVIADEEEAARAVIQAL